MEKSTSKQSIEEKQNINQDIVESNTLENAQDDIGFFSRFKDFFRRSSEKKDSNKAEVSESSSEKEPNQLEQIQELFLQLESKFKGSDEKAKNVVEEMKDLQDLLKQLEGKDSKEENKFQEFLRKFYLILDKIQNLQTEYIAQLPLDYQGESSVESTNEETSVSTQQMTVGEMKNYIQSLDNPSFSFRFEDGFYMEDVITNLSLGNEKVIKARLQRVQDLISTIGFSNEDLIIDVDKICFNIERDNYEEILKELLLRIKVYQEIFSLVQNLNNQYGTNSKIFASVVDFDYSKFEETRNKIPRLVQLLKQINFNCPIILCGTDAITGMIGGDFMLNIEKSDWETQLLDSLKQLKKHYPNEFLEMEIPDSFPPNENETLPPSDFDPTKINWEKKSEVPDSITLKDIEEKFNELFPIPESTAKDTTEDMTEDTTEDTTEEIVAQILKKRFGGFASKTLETVKGIVDKAKEKIPKPEDKKETVLKVIETLNRTVSPIIGAKILGDAGLYFAGRGDIYALKEGRREIKDIIQSLKDYQKIISDSIMKESEEGSESEDEETNELKEKAEDLRKKITEAKYLNSEAQKELLDRLDGILEKYKEGLEKLKEKRDKKVEEEVREYLELQEINKLDLLTQAQIQTYLIKKVSEISFARDVLSPFAYPTGMVAARGFMYGGAAIAERARKAANEAQRKYLESQEKEEKFNRLTYVLKDVFVHAVLENITLGKWTKKKEIKEDGSVEDKRTDSEKKQDKLKAFGALFRMLGIGGATLAELSEGAVFEKPINALIEAVKEGTLLKKIAENTGTSFLKSTSMFHSPIETTKKILRAVPGIHSLFESAPGEVAVSDVTTEPAPAVESKPAPIVESKSDPVVESEPDSVAEASDSDESNEEGNEKDSQPEEVIENSTENYLDSFIADNNISENGQAFLQSLVEKYPSLNSQENLEAIWDNSSNSGSLERSLVNRDEVIFNILVKEDQTQAIQFLQEDLDVHGSALSLLRQKGYDIEGFVEAYKESEDPQLLRRLLHRANSTLIANNFRDQGVDFSVGRDVGVRGPDAHILGFDEEGNLVVEGENRIRIFQHKKAPEPASVVEPEPAPAVKPELLDNDEDKEARITRGVNLIKQNIAKRNIFIDTSQSFENRVQAIKDAMLGVGIREPEVETDGMSQTLQNTEYVLGGIFFTVDDAGNLLADGKVIDENNINEISEQVSKRFSQQTSEPTNELVESTSEHGHELDKRELQDYLTRKKALLIKTESGRDYLLYKGIMKDDNNITKEFDIIFDLDGNRVGFVDTKGRGHFHDPREGWPSGTLEQLPPKKFPESVIREQSSSRITETEKITVTDGKVSTEESTQNTETKSQEETQEPASTKETVNEDSEEQVVEQSQEKEETKPEGEESQGDVAITEESPVAPEMTPAQDQVPVTPTVDETPKVDSSSATTKEEPTVSTPEVSEGGPEKPIERDSEPEPAPAEDEEKIVKKELEKKVDSDDDDIDIEEDVEAKKATSPEPVIESVSESGSYKKITIPKLEGDSTNIIELDVKGDKSRLLKIDTSFMTKVNEENKDFAGNLTLYARDVNDRRFKALQEAMSGNKDYILEYDSKAKDLLERIRIKHKGEIVK